MIVIVTGSRTFTDFKAVARALAALAPAAVWHGGAKGADSLASTWCSFTGTPSRVFLPDWSTHGKAAGVIRSVAMLNQAPARSTVAAFCKGPLSGSPGTQACVKAARRLGMRVRLFYDW